MKPTYDELFQILRELQQQVAVLQQERITLQEENARLRKRVQELEERLALNSKNSSKPPSTDQQKNKTKPRGGGKPGHKGHSRPRYKPDEVTKRVHSALEKCPCCGSCALTKLGESIFQQVDIPQIVPEVTEIIQEKVRCQQCGKKSTAPWPTEYRKSSFGPRIVSLIAMCSAVYRMGKRVIQVFLETVCKIKISLGSIPTVEDRVSKGLEPAYQILLQKVDGAYVAYIDETRFRQEARTHHVWTVTTKEVALIRILKTRGLDSLAKIRPRGHDRITVTDRYGVYAYKRHQYCLAHIKRDLERFTIREGPDKELAERALFELREIFIAAKTPLEEKRGKVSYRKRKLEKILEEIMANGGDKFSRFANRLLDEYKKLFLFTRYPEVECTNNAAERTLRHIVMWRKTSQGTQSEAGSRFLERAVSVWMTLKKQGKEPLPFFEKSYLSTFQPNTEAPVI